jgi:diguanylate cyclase (GGDEF)-like protein/PAS domain S-box-containing protein
MSFRFGLITCSSFEREVQSVQASADFRNVLFLPHRVCCDLAESEWAGLGEAVASCRKEGCAVGLAGGYCLTRPVKELGLDGACRLHQESQCYEWVADKGLLDRLLHEGALPVLPGWIRDWEAHVDSRWPSDRKAAQSFFRDVARKVVLLDTGVYPMVDRELKSFGRFLRLSCDVHPVGLDHFRLALSRSVLSWSVDVLRTENADRMAVFGQRIGDITRIGRLLGAVTNVKSMEEAQAGVLELARVMLSPQEAVYHPVESFCGRSGPEGSPIDRIIGLNADSAWSDDRRTAFLKVAHGREILGVLELTGIGGAERGDHDLDLAMTLARISGLALAGVRTGRSLEAVRERAAAAEAALASGDEKMTRIFNYPLGLYRTTPQGEITDASPTLARMLGYPDVEALKAVNFWDLHNDPRDRENKEAFLNSTTMVGIFEFQLRRTNGTLVWAEDSCRAAKDPFGRALFYDGVIQDITARKKMKDEHSWVVHLQNAVREVSERLLSPTPIEEMSSLVLDQARRLTGSLSGFVGHVDQRTGGLLPAALTPDAREMLGGHAEAAGRFHENSGMWRWALEERRAILTTLPSLDPRYGGMPEWHLPVGPLLAVPAIMSGAIVGLVVVANPENPYLEKDLKAVERLADLYAIAVQRTRTEDALREMSLVDELTKVYNRRGFLTVAEQQMKVAHRTKKEMSLFYADLDDLKRINDSFGHDQGDAALVDAADLLKDAFRESDIIARIGGDEFVVLAIDIAEGKVSALSRRLREKVQARNARPDCVTPIAFSVGISRYDPDRPCSLQELLAQADRRMYQEKTSKKREPAAA